MKAQFFYILYLALSMIHILSIAWSRWSKKGKVRKITKPLLMPTLLLFYVFASKDPQPLIILALITSFFGDCFLMFDKNAYKALGVISFGLTHIFYGLHFARYVNWGVIHPVMLSIILYLIIFLVVMVRLRQKSKREYYFQVTENFRFPIFLGVKFYAILLISMSYLALNRAAFHPGAGSFLTAIGSFLFIVSDILLAFAYFQKRRNRGVMPFYLAGQLMIILGLII